VTRTPPASADTPLPRATGWRAEATGLGRDLAGARDRGDWRAAAREIQEFLYDRVFRHGRLVVMEQDLDRVPAIPAPPGVEIRPLVLTSPAGEWSAVETLAGVRRALRFRKALARGRVCLVAWRNARAIGYAWLAERVDADLESFPVPLPRGAVYAAALFVAPPERGAGVGAALVSARLLEGRKRGYRSAWRVADPRNHAGLRTIERSSGGGNRVVGTLRYAKLLGRSVGRFHPAATGEGQPAGRPRLVRG
jgi:GNAT superfamily N-acetyltransferase